MSQKLDAKLPRTVRGEVRFDTGKYKSNGRRGRRTRPEGENLRYRRAAMLACIGLATALVSPACLAQANLAGRQSNVPQNWPANSGPRTVDIQAGDSQKHGTQAPDAPIPEPSPIPALPTGTHPGPALKITLMEALTRARAVSPSLERAVLNVKIAGEEKTQTRALNLPTVSSNSQYLYTQGNGTPAARFIANNGVHEYIGQGVAHEVLSATQVVQYRHSIVMEALARDQAAIAQRGLEVTVVQSYATLVAADHKYATLQEATVAAQDFLTTTQDLETGGEVAHADVVKAQIQLNDSEVAFEDGQLAREQARVSLALLLFPDVNQNFEVVEEPGQFLSLPAFDQAQAEAQHRNPTIDATLDTERAASQDVTAARTGYLPTLTFDYFYGIDANHFATKTPSLSGPIQNLGYSALASLNAPVWNWGSTHSKVKQAEYRKQQAVTDRKFAQRQLSANLEQFYSEAKIARSQMALLQRSANDTQESLKLTLLRYKAGEATALEVVNAQSTLSLERNAYEDAQTRYASALANLATLTGTL